MDLSMDPSENSAPPKTWCKFCTLITLSALTSRRKYFHHPTTSALFVSARTCSLCKLFCSMLALSSEQEAEAKNEWLTQVVLQAWVGPQPHMYLSDRVQYRPGKHELTGLAVYVITSCECAGSHKKDFSACEGCTPAIKKAYCGIYTRDDTSDYIHKVVQGQKIPESSAHPDAMRSVAGWIQSCQSNHQDCVSGLGDDFKDVFPTRVVNVGHAETGPSISAYLSSAPYLALSHRWTPGPAPDWVTSKANITTRSTELDENALPGTIRDALSTTRKLGYKYIWIDSLCIIQDDNNDWASEASKMAGIYANASVTLSADVAPDDETGFLGKRTALGKSDGSFWVKDTSQSPTFLRIYLRYIDEFRTRGLTPMEGSMFSSDVLKSPMSTRGWILQERVLSPRLLHFGKTQMFWECRSACLAEDGHTFDEGARNDLIAPFYKVISGSSTSTDSIYRAWLLILQEYTQRLLTRNEDKLPALSGLAQVVGSKVKSRYLAGLWEGNLHQDLLWERYGSDPEPHGTWRAPSWSWAEINGRIGHATMEGRMSQTWIRGLEPKPRSSNSKHTTGGAGVPTSAYNIGPGFRLTNADIKLQGPNPFGKVLSASLRIRGVLRSVVNIGPMPTGNHPLYDADTNMIPVANIRVDYSNAVLREYLFCLKVLERPSNGSHYCLILKATESEGEYVRVGTAVLRAVYWDLKDDMFEGLEESDVVLV